MHRHWGQHSQIEEQGKNRRTLLSRIMLSMIAFGVLQIIVFVFILAINGVFSSVRSYSYNTVLEKTENRKNYVESLLNQKTSLVYETATSINSITDSILKDMKLTAASISESKELNRRILEESAETLISLLRRDMVNDVFLILDTGTLYDEGDRSLRPGLYLRDTDVGENSLADNKDIFMEMGSSEIAREFGLPLDFGWSLHLDVTDETDGKRDFFFEPIRSYNHNAQTPLYNLGYWGRVTQLSESQQGCIKYSLPLVSDDGTVYGVVGIGLLEKTIKQNMPAIDFLDESACFILAADFTGDEQYCSLLYSGPFYRRMSGDVTVEKVQTVGYNLYEFTLKGELECLSNVQELNLYNSGSPYRSQKWAIISVAEKYEALGMYYALVRTVLMSIGLTLLVCVLSAVMNSRSLSLPVAKMMEELKQSQRNNTPVNFHLSGTSEIDALADAVMSLQEQIAKTKDDEYMARLLEANAALRDSAAAAKRASSAKTDFLSRMSHDIRTPMNAIIGITAIAEQNLDNPEKMADCPRKISSSSRYLLSLINEVLDMNKIESGQFVLAQEPLNIIELVNNLVEMERSAVREKHHQLNVQIHSITHENVIGDSLRIQQMFLNIVSNSIKYTPAGGQISITVSERDVGQKLVTCYKFVFEDNGIGMSPEFLEKAFTPFERAEDSRVNREQGTGLGLAIVDNIVKLMDGTIQVESEVGKGSKFTVLIYLRLPDESSTVGEDTPPTDTSPDDGEEEDFTGVRVLLVDDNELNREIAMELLNMAGLEVELAEDGKQAVERFSASVPGYYDIILMDVQMPVMNGYEATVAIRALARQDAQHIPIVAITANAFAEDVQDAHNAGMNEHLAKPIDMDKLYQTLRRWVSKPSSRQEKTDEKSTES